MTQIMEAPGAAGRREEAGAPFYDPTLSYQENYDRGPFGLFATSPEKPAPVGKPKYFDFLGAELGLPLGIPAGPLLNANFVAAAFRWGYNLCHYKTVRSRFWPSHPYPNVLRLDAAEPFDPADQPDALRARPFPPAGIVPGGERAGISITNSFGMPAQAPEVWQRDVTIAAEAARPGQVLAVSVVGTPDAGDTQADFARDYARAAAMAASAGAMVVEANLSCPNLGGHGLLCHDIAGSAEVCARIKEATPDTPLHVKLGNYSPDSLGEEALEGLVEALLPYVSGFAAINAVPYPVVDDSGAQALPGKGRLRAGICGLAIRDMGLDVVRRLDEIRRRAGAGYGIIGVGGVMTPDDFFAYRAAGADVVQGATGPMWRPQLALEIAARLGVEERS